MHKTFFSLLSLLPAAILFLVSAACGPQGIDEAGYITRIQEERKARDAEIVDSATSRFNAAEREAFARKGLQYFPPDMAFRVNADFTLDTSNPVFQMPTTTDRKPNYRIYGYLDFEVRDTACRLVVFQNYDYRNHPEHGKYLFIPFKDNTNEFTTYGGGRYIDIEIPTAGSTVLDFNEAYNPYCAYADRWSCPLVPGMNTLEVSIPAGEKTYK